MCEEWSGGNFIPSPKRTLQRPRTIGRDLKGFPTIPTESIFRCEKTVSFKEGFMCFLRKMIQNAIDTIFGIQELGYDMNKNYHDWNYEYKKTSQKKRAVFFE